MSHSTHVGFSEPPICSLNGLEFLSCVAWLALPLFQSRAVGVATFSTAVAKPSPLVGLAPLRLWFPQTVGVGHNRSCLT